MSPFPLQRTPVFPATLLALLLLLPAGPPLMAQQAVQARQNVQTEANSAVADSSWGIGWHTMQRAQQQATERGRKVLVYARAEWCTYCKRMEKQVLPDGEVGALIERHFMPVKVDVESDSVMQFNGRSLSQRQFSNEMRAVATPTFVFISAEGKVLGIQPGFLPKNTFMALLTYVGTDAYKEMDAGSFIKQWKEEHGGR